MRIVPHAFLFSAFLAPVMAFAQANLVSNGGFETVSTRQNLWEGVDSTGFLASERGYAPVLTTVGSIGDTAMPVSVGIADMNSDGLLDIVCMDVVGYLRIYFNSGTPQEPAFTVSELAAIYISRTSFLDPAMAPIALNPGNTPRFYLRQAPRIHVTDLMKTGKSDILVGDYLGEIFLLSNVGSIQKPEFKQPLDVGRLAIPTMKDPTKKWGNVFAPVVWDWNKDGKDDIILGEGSYSANNIHLLLNTGSGAKPIFEESSRYVLAYGGASDHPVLEQLTPAVVDYNGDGLPDLLVSERTGKIAVFLNKGGNWKPGDTIPFTSFLGVGGNATTPLSTGALCTITTGDLNGDGLFDLVLGKSNGRIAISMNSGTKTEPKFTAPVELKGDKSDPVPVPTSWDMDFGLMRGNFYGYMTTANKAADPLAEPSEGSTALRIGYFKSPNKYMPAPVTYTGAYPGFKITSAFSSGTATDILNDAPANYFMLRQNGSFQFTVGKSYTLSFKVKGGKISNGQAIIGYAGTKKMAEDRINRQERSAVTIQEMKVEEQTNEIVTFSGGPQWTEVKKDFTVRLKKPELKDMVKTTGTSLQISFGLQPTGGDVYIDDVKIVEKTAP